MPFAIVLILLVVGSILFHLLSPWTFTPLASNWGMIDFTVDITLWVTAFVFVAVNLFMAYAIIRFRHRKGEASKAKYEPENKRLETWLTGLTAIGVAAMLTPGLFVWAKFVNVPEEAHVVEAIGQQWHWTYRFPGADGKFGDVRAELISNDNPFGMVAEDPQGRDDVLVYSPEVHLPVDRPVKFLLRSKDVLHNFTVAQFRVKMDLVPGISSYLWLTPTEVGRFEVLCEELCGIAHHTMRGAVVVQETAEFERWLAQYPTYRETVNVPAPDPALGAAAYTVCSACHGAQGEGMQATNAPTLAGQEAWYLRRQLSKFKAGVRGSHAEDVHGQQMMAMARTLVDDAAINNVVAYIQTFPVTTMPATVQGNVENGRKRYQYCAYCHGDRGQGIQAMNAPRLAGVRDWYLKNQLIKLREDIRGGHPEDFYGKQMTFMGYTLQDDREIDDVVAYINTLQIEPPADTVAVAKREE